MKARVMRTRTVRTWGGEGAAPVTSAAAVIIHTTVDGTSSYNYTTLM